MDQLTVPAIAAPRLDLGLSSAEAQARLAAIGPNAVPEERVHPLRRALRHFWAPVPWMLEVAIVLQFAIGERLGAALIAILLLLNAGLGFVQEARANTTLALLKQRLALKVRACRDHAWMTITAPDLVPGDVVQLSLGAIVPADVRILSGSLSLDQSMLTGESIAVEVGPGKTGYAGALVRRGEAIGVVTATGMQTYFGKTAELVRVAHVESSEQKAVLGVVRALTVVNFAIVVAMVAYAQSIGMTVLQMIPLVLTALLSAVPVALPATFTLAAAVSARMLALRGVLLTRLSALQEAAMIDVLCVDKTGTLTENALGISGVRPTRDGTTEAAVLRLAAAASSVDGQDAIDSAIRAAAPDGATALRVTRFVPFDPTRKMAEATVIDARGRTLRVVKGSPPAIALVAAPNARSIAAEQAFMAAGYRTLAVAAGSPNAMEMVGLVAFSDRPRVDSAPLLAELASLGVRTVMVTGDTAATATTVAREIGLAGAVCPPEQMRDDLGAEEFAIFAGVFPEDKFRLVRALQRRGHAVGMCGDGANDAPALRQAQMGIAVSTATDVAKSAAGLVLTEPGLGGIVTSIREGRSAFQRVLTYTLGLLVNKCVTLVVMSLGLMMTGHAVLTPLLQGIWLVGGDLVTMARAADHAQPTSYPNAWRVRELTLAAIPLGTCKLAYCVGVIAFAWYVLHLSAPQMQTLTFLMLLLGGQAITYVLRERRHVWRSRPAPIMLIASATDIAAITVLAAAGWLMAALPGAIIAGLFASTCVLALALDMLKIVVLRRLPIDRRQDRAAAAVRA